MRSLVIWRTTSQNVSVSVIRPKFTLASREIQYLSLYDIGSYSFIRDDHCLARTLKFLAVGRQQPRARTRGAAAASVVGRTSAWKEKLEQSDLTSTSAHISITRPRASMANTSARNLEQGLRTVPISFDTPFHLCIYIQILVVRLFW